MQPGRRVFGAGAAILVGGAALALGTGVAFAGTTGTTSPSTTVRIAICHATGPYTYVVENPSELAVLNGQYATYRDARDIIPPFTHNGKSYAGRNWTPAGQAILKAGCVDANAPKPKPKPTPQPQPQPQPQPVAVVSSDDEAAEAATADVVPTTSTHAGEYAGGWSGGQWAAVALTASGAVTTGGALLRRRLVQRG